MPSRVNLSKKMSKPKSPELNLGTANAKQAEFFKSRCLYTMYGGARGGGKALWIDEFVCTPFGFKRMGDIKVGDVVIGKNGRPTSVIGVHPQGEKPCYKFTFVDGATCIVSEDHLWTVKRTCSNRKRSNPWIVKTTRMLYDEIKKSTNSNWLIPLCDPVRFTVPSRNGYPIKPYTLGALIGDGCLCGKSVSFTTADAEIIKAIRDDGYTVNKYREKYAYGFANFSDEFRWLRNVGLNVQSELKFIPKQYLYAPLDVRYELIRGLMDTDGYADKRGHCTFCTVSKRLANDVQWMIRSIGGKATITEKHTTYTDQQGNKLNGQLAYEVYIQTPDNSALFKLKRKKSRCEGKKFNGGVSELNRRIIKIEPVGNLECQCITVDSPDGLFLTRDFIVTHNSWAIRTKAVGGALTWPGIRILILRRTYPELQQNHIEPIIKMVPQSVGAYNGSLRTMYFKNGSFIKFGHANSLLSIETEYQGKLPCPFKQ